MISTTLCLLTTTRAGSNSQLSAETVAVEFGSATDRAPGDRQPIWTSDGSEPGSVPHVSGDDPSDVAPECPRVQQLRSLQTCSATGPGAGNLGRRLCLLARAREWLSGSHRTLAAARTIRSDAGDESNQQPIGLTC